MARQRRTREFLALRGTCTSYEVIKHSRPTIGPRAWSLSRSTPFQSVSCRSSTGSVKRQSKSMLYATASCCASVLDGEQPAKAALGL